MDQEFSELCLAIHGGVHERPPWSGFLDLARRRFALGYAGLIFRWPGRGRRILREFQDSDRDLREHRQRNLLRIDPFPEHAMEPGRVYRLREMPFALDPGSSGYYRDYLRPAGFADLMAMLVAEPGYAAGWLTFARDRPDSFDDDTEAAMRALAPHLAVAIRSLALGERYRIERSIFRRANRHQLLGAVALGSNLRVLGAGRQARTLLTGVSGLRIGSDGTLHIADEQVRRRLAEAAAAFEQGGVEWAFRVQGSPPIEALVTQPTHEFAAVAPAAILYLHAPLQRPSRPKRPAHLMSLFGMTPLEARITDALCDGSSFAEIARDLRLSEQTVRSYSKAIFAKTGAKRQAEVVRIVLESIASML